MKDFLFFKHHFILDLVVSLAFGSYAGYQGRLEAESGEFHPDLLWRAALVGGVAFGIAWVVSSTLQHRFRLSLSMLWIMILGPSFFGIGYRGMVYLEGLQDKPFSIADFIAIEGKYVLALAVFHVVPFLLCLLMLRVFTYLTILITRKLYPSSGFTLIR